MPETLPIDIDAAWTAFDARDRRRDGRFVVAVHTTRIYCKPSCPARRPKRENVSFYHDGAEAQAAGYRACLRCKPDDAARDRVAVAQAIALIEADTATGLDALAAAVATGMGGRTGISPRYRQPRFDRKRRDVTRGAARLYRCHARDSPHRHRRRLDRL